MKFILTVLLTVGVGLGVLRTDLTPWRIVNKEQLQARVPAHVEGRMVVPAAASAADHSGDWMRDPNYRSALEKTTVVGRPEGAASRDAAKPAPTPYRRH